MRILGGLLASRLIGRSSAAGRVEQIFRRTQGLPLTITELGRLGELEEGMDAPVPISSIVERAYARGVEAAPEQVRSLLLVAAADDSGDVTTVLPAAERLQIAATAAEGAEELGLIEIADGRIRFRHALVRSCARRSTNPPPHQRDAARTGGWRHA